jgi:hypothetical protein
MFLAKDHPKTPQSYLLLLPEVREIYDGKRKKRIKEKDMR